jgi:ABC-type transporter Mla subunit MlaD
MATSTKSGLTRKQYNEAREVQRKADALKANAEQVESYKASIESYTEQIKSNNALAAALRAVAIDHSALTENDSYFQRVLQNAESNANYARQYRTDAENRLAKLEAKMAGKVDEDDDDEY